MISGAALVAAPARAEVRLGLLVDGSVATPQLTDPALPAHTHPGERRFGAGALVSLSLGRRGALVLQPMLLQKGGALEQEAQGLRVRVSERLTYVEVPLLLQYSALRRDSTHVYLLAGPTAGRLLDARTWLSVDGQVARDDDATRDAGRWDAGVALGAGLGQGFGRLRLFVEAQHTIGLLDVDNDAARVFRNRGTHVRAGFSFGFGAW